MNSALIAADCLPRGGEVKVETSTDQAAPSFKITASGTGARVLEDVLRAVRGESTADSLDARGVQPYLTNRLARGVNAGLTMTSGDGQVVLTAG
jgi:histidine phosphotransferase ChpT